MEATEIQTSDQRLELKLTTAQAPPRRKSGRQHIAEVAQFLAVVAQFGLVVLLVQYWQLESQLLARLMWLAFVGFVIHHLLPLRFRLPFFATLSLFAVIAAVGHFGPNVGVAWLTGKLTTAGFLYHLVPGLTLVGIGLGLIGICHLPVRFTVRAGLVAVAGVGLVFLRAHSQWFPDVTEMWVVLGS